MCSLSFLSACQHIFKLDFSQVTIPSYQSYNSAFPPHGSCWLLAHHQLGCPDTAHSRGLISAALLESTSDALTTRTCAEYRPDFLWQREDASKLDQLHKYLIGEDSSRSQHPALHQLLEKNTTHLINHLNCWKESMLQEITQAVENTIQRLLPSPAAPEPHTTSRRTFITVEDTPRAVSGLSSSGNRDFLVPVKTGDKTEGKGKKTVKLESPEPSRMWKLLHTPLSLKPPQVVVPGTPERPKFPTEPANTSHTNQDEGFIAAQPGETEEEKEIRTMHNLATIMGRALSVLLQSAFRSLSQTPGPAQPKSKIPAPEKYEGKKGPAAKSFILNCKTYFFSNSSSFPSDHSRISFVLMNLKEGQPKNWDAFEAAFLCNWSDPAAAQVAERRLRDLKQSRAASDYATDFRIIASELAEVRSKLIEFTLHKNITTLDEFISTACLIDDTPFEARQELRKDSNPSTSAPCPAQGRSGDFVSRRVQEQRRKAGECTNRRFSAVFHLLPLGNRNLILGTPWLILANPDINWCTLEVLLRPSEKARKSDIAPPITSIPEEFKGFQKVFSDDFFTTRPAHCFYDCAIPLEDGKDISYGPIYPMTPSETAALKEHIDSELAAGKICPSTSPAGVPVMFVKRADGRLCLVVDYRRLNAIKIKDHYALPKQDELIEKLRHAKIFTKLDLRNGYNNICIKEGNKWKSAFRTKYGHFEPTVMQFGLSNAPAVFQCFMNNTFRDLLDITVIVYLDNILIFSNSREEHVQHVTEVLSCLQKHNLFCNPSKGVFFVTEVTYIGLVVTPEGISMEHEKVKVTQEWPEPKNVKQHTP
ncbi:Retrotransposable element Tf2 155 kDa protein type 2 [Rhizoctonia solani AG-1 IB]|uniref:Retrotransposable element Tf2 155 kDa protein type 2 n=1 Tax=Thanatephorus cucumeris (strain AG1-IB / isolate 7/3/14) TaxID=1108050 RepID=M5C4Q9_THACB|nr:Retrotransposable element Tf2 155 kDa protein type 2 [Rhizoctonia solani AG-1 IB]